MARAIVTLFQRIELAYIYTIYSGLPWKDVI